jgi:hypothetical protein
MANARKLLIFDWSGMPLRRSLVHILQMWYQIRSFFSFVGSLLQILLHLRTCNSWGWLCHFGFGFRFRFRFGDGEPHFGLSGSVTCGPLRRPDSAARRRTPARNSSLSANAQFKKYARPKGQEIICVLGSDIEAPPSAVP